MSLDKKNESLQSIASWVPIQSCVSNLAEAGFIKNELKNAGIDSVIKSNASHTETASGKILILVEKKRLK